MVLAATGAVGFFVGMILEPTWQDVIEPGQVLAGLVDYPTDNPVFLYSTRTWTLLHQISAALLLAGFSERTLALLLSGVVGMLSLQALGTTIFALSDDVPLACATPFFVFFTRATSGGLAYPVMLAGSEYTSGVVGLSFLLLVCAMIGAGEYACGAFLLGIIPAVHVTLGAWCALIVGLTAWLGDGEVRTELLRAWGWLGVGAAVSGLSAVLHFARVAPVDGLTSDESARYFWAVMTYWDAHRRPFTRLSIQAVPFLIGTAVSAVWLRRFRATLPRASSFLLGALLVSAVLGAALSVVLAVDPGFARGLLWRAMPSRLMNLPLLACMAVIIGIGGGLKSNLRGQLTLATLVGTLAAVYVVALAATGRLVTVSYVAMFATALFLAGAAREMAQGGAATPVPGRAFRVSRLVTIGTPVLLLVIAAMDARAHFSDNGDVLADRTTSEVFAAAAGRTGLLLTASNIHLAQLKTRRPVLVDGAAIDGLAYVPEAAPATERILREVYGIDLLAPPFSPRSAVGSVPADTGKRLWEDRTAADWVTLGHRFGVTDVLTFADWRLHLPEVARADGFVLYAISQ